MKRVCACLLAIALLVPMFVISASAATSGSCGVNWSYNSSTKTLRIYGSGDMRVFMGNMAGHYEWDDFCTEVENLVIEDGVTSIAKAAFWRMRSLTSVSIANTVTAIGESAFIDCDSLPEITIPDSVTSVGGGAFKDCGALTKVTMPGVSISEAMFYSCDNLAEVVIGTPAGTNLSVGKQAFYGCKALTAITLPEGFATIGEYAFIECEALNQVELPTSLKYIERNAFEKCGALTQIDLPEGLKTIGNYAFKNSGLESVTIPNSVTELPNASFMYCESLVSVTLPEGLTTIGNGLFNYCSALTHITIPASVTSLDCAFYKCESLSQISFLGDAPAFTSNAFSRLTMTVYYPYGNNTWTEEVMQQYGGTITWQVDGGPLKIVKQPQSVEVAEGENVTITVEAQGQGLTYQWYYKSPGSSKFKLTTSFTGNTYTTTMSAARNGRQVYCVVTDKYGNSEKTNVVTMKMTGSVTITKQPADVTVANGKEVVITVEAKGEGLTYKWYFKNPGSNTFQLTKTFTGNTYTATMNTARNGRQVYCVITDKNGYSEKTDVVTMKMAGSVTITKQPVNVIMPEGEEAVVTVQATGDGLTYKWYFKNANTKTFHRTDTFTGNTYTAVMNAARSGRQIYCVITDKYGNSVKTDVVTLTMGTALKITQQPKDVAVPDGEAVVITVGAQGDGLTYAWYYKNPGTSKFKLTTSFTGNTYTTEMSAARDGRQVYCVITDKHGNSVKTDVVTMKRYAGIVITKQPENVTAYSGQQVVITVEAEGEGLTYAWYYMNRGASKFSLTKTFTGNTYTTEMNTTRSGRQVYCVITDKYGNSVATDTVTMWMGE